MNFQIDPTYIRRVILGVVVLFLIISVYFGFRAGRELAQSQLAVDQSGSVAQSLGYFFSDQDRYPSKLEFSDPNVFGPYLSTVPLKGVTSTQCPSLSAYDTVDKRTFTFTYCLPRALGERLAGSYTITQRTQ